MRVTRSILFAVLPGLFAFQAVAVAEEAVPPAVAAATPPARPLRGVYLPEIPTITRERPEPKPSAPARVSYAPFTLAGPVDMLEVDIGRQRLMVWNDGAIVTTSPVSTGMDGYNTPTGRFRIQAKAVNGWSREWQVVMPWMMPFQGNYTFHQLTHARGSTRLNGASQLGSRASHGCIRLPYGVAETLYHKTAVGTPVWIHY